MTPQAAERLDKRDDGSFEWEDRARFEREAKPHAMIGKDGKVFLTNPPWYRGGEAVTLCRGDKWSRDWLTGIAVGLFGNALNQQLLMQIGAIVLVIFALATLGVFRWLVRQISEHFDPNKNPAAAALISILDFPNKLIYSEKLDGLTVALDPNLVEKARAA